jgi:endonuclease YncB( thermonuclease family)
VRSQVRSRKGGGAQFVLLAAIAVGAGVVSSAGELQAPAQAIAAADRDCDDFSTQQQAQNLFEDNGPGSDPHQLDGDGDGRACEDLPCPCGSGGGGGGGGDTGGGGDGGGGSPDPPRDLTDNARVTDIADGDTIEVRVHGRSRDVRVVGIDSAEVYGGTECGGPEASAAIKRLLQPGDKVRLVRDLSQDAVDRYGRMLRYVEHGGLDIGRKQILRGHARVYVYDNNPFKRVKSYRKAQRKAKRADRGNWGNCGGRFRAIALPGFRVSAAANKPVVLCWNKDYPEPVGDGDAQVRVKPSKCAFFKRGEAANFAAVRVQSLNWKRWGTRRAVGVGKSCSPMSGTCTRVEVKLTRVVDRCGRRAFSKARFEFAGGTAPDPDFKLYTC